MARREIRFGVIGLGLMGREFASAVGRWMHLLDLDFRPVITGICDVNAALFGWFDDNFDTITVRSTVGVRANPSAMRCVRSTRKARARSELGHLGAQRSSRVLEHTLRTRAAGEGR